MNWLDFWNGDTPIYVNERHKSVHYAGIAKDILSHLPGPSARVADYGCGEALSAGAVAARCGYLYLSDGAQQVRERLSQRFFGVTNIGVVSPEQFESLPDRSLDLVIVNSVVQYLSEADLSHLLAVVRQKLALSGKLIVADVIPRTVGPLTDATALLSLAARNGFLIPAALGLVRTAFSDYRKLRSRLGLAHFDEAEFLDRLAKAGFNAQKLPRNFGHNQGRMAFAATARP